MINETTRNESFSSHAPFSYSEISLMSQKQIVVHEFITINV